MVPEYSWSARANYEQSAVSGSPPGHFHSILKLLRRELWTVVLLIRVHRISYFNVHYGMQQPPWNIRRSQCGFICCVRRNSAVNGCLRCMSVALSALRDFLPPARGFGKHDPYLENISYIYIFSRALRGSGSISACSTILWVYHHCTTASMDLQRLASPRSPCFVMFFYASCEGLLGQ